MDDVEAALENGETRVAVVAEDGDDGQRLDLFLANRLDDLSRSRIQALIRGGSVHFGTGDTESPGAAVEDPKRKVRAGEQFVVVMPPPVPAEPSGEAIPLAVVYEDDDLVVIDKPAGLVVHPAAGHETGTLVNALIAHCGAGLSGIGGVARPGIVHRLDKDTTGLLVVAKSDRAHRGLQEQFASHGADGRLSRAYRALVWGMPLHVQGRIEAPIGRSSANRLKMAVVSETRGRFAATHYERLEPLGLGGPAEGHGKGQHNAGPLASELRLVLETGRTHQIRVHLAHIGHPVIGDPLYGAGFKSRAKRFDEGVAAALEATKRQMLHAAELGFEHPVTGEPMEFSTPPPADYLQLKAKLNTF